MNPADLAAMTLADPQAAAPAPVEETPLPVTTADAETNAQAMPASILDTPQAVEVLSPDQPIETAGIVDRIVTKLGKRTADAEKRVLPPLPDKVIQQQGNSLLVRGLEQDEVDKLSAILPGYTKGINLPRLAEAAGDMNLAEYMQQLKNANADLFEKARRGTLNFDALLAKADKTSPDQHIVKWLKYSKEQGMLPEDQLGGVLAATQLTKETQAIVLQGMSMAAGPERDAIAARSMQMMAMEGQLYANLSGNASEAARTLQVLSQAGRLAETSISRRSEELQGLFSSANSSNFEYLGQAYLSLPVGARAEFVRQGVLSKFMDVIAEVYINSLLSNPVTHVVNVAGNTIFMGTRIAETGLAGAIGAVRSKITGNADRVYASEALAQMDGIRGGFMDALVVAGKTFINEEAADTVSKMEVRNRRAIGTTGDPLVMLKEFQQGNYVAGAVNVIGTTTRMPGRFLLAEDQFFKGIGYRMHIHGEAQMRASRAYEQAIELGKTPQEALALANIEKQRILTAPPENVIADAQAAAREMTFQKDLGDGFLGAAGQALSHPVAKLFVPFFKTPTNIAKATFERSPLQMINPGFYKTIAAGGREADIAMSKVALGSMVMGTFAYAAMGLEGDGNVKVTGAGPVEQQAKDAFLREGMQPYSIAIRQDDGTWRNISYNRFDPLSGILAMAADYAYYAQHETNGSVLEDLALASTMSLTNYMLQQPLLQGVNELATIFRGTTPEDKAKALHKWLGENPATAVLSMAPGNSAAGAAVSRYNNPDRANTMLPAEGVFGEDPTQLPDFVKGFYIALQKAKAQNPYFNKDLPPALNEWGEKIPASNGTAWEFVSPIKIRDSKYAPVDAEIQKLGGGVSRTDKKLNGVELNAEQFNRLIELTNGIDHTGKKAGEPGFQADQTLLPTLMKVISDPAYQALPTKNDKQDQLSNVVSLYRRAAREMLLMEQPGLKARIDAQP